MAFIAKERLTLYNQLLTKDGGLTAEDLLTINDMITEDLTGREVAEATADKLTSDNQGLRDTNHKLFLRVTGGTSPTQVEGPELSPEEQAEGAFNKLIQEGVL